MELKKVTATVNNLRAQLGDDLSVGSSLTSLSNKSKGRKTVIKNKSNASIPEAISEGGDDGESWATLTTVATAAGPEAIKAQIETLESKLAGVEESKAQSKSAVKVWMDDFQKANGRPPSNSDNAKARHLFEAYAKVNITLSALFFISYGCYDIGAR